MKLGRGAGALKVRKRASMVGSGNSSNADMRVAKIIFWVSPLTVPGLNPA